MKLMVAKIEYVLINSNKLDKHTQQPQRRVGTTVCAGDGREGAVASLMEELHPEETGEVMEITRLDIIRDGVTFHPQEFAIPAKDLRAAAEAVQPQEAKPFYEGQGPLCQSDEAGIVCGEPQSAHTPEAAMGDVGMDHKFEPPQESAT